MKSIILMSKKELFWELKDSDGNIFIILKKSKNLESAREQIFVYLNSIERHYFNILSDKHYLHLDILERSNAKECVRVLKNIIRTENEKLTGFSALKTLYALARDKDFYKDVSEGFIIEFIFLFKGINGKSTIFPESTDVKQSFEGRNGAIVRSESLDKYASKMNNYFRKYAFGCDIAIVHKRNLLKKKIMKHFGASERDWNNPSWQIKNVITNYRLISKFVHLDEIELNGLIVAEKRHIPVQITPYYLSLFDQTGKSEIDRCIRAQVMPSSVYSENVYKNKISGSDMDFMGEGSTSPIDCITRRYSNIVILKPFDSCPQICIYCQRNWEIKTLNEAKITKKRIIKAINWIKKNKYITEVLVTGGDPFTLNNAVIDWILKKLSAIVHVERIRIGTRTLVTMPMRIDEGLVKILKKYHQWGKREILIVTHFEHASEITPDVITAVNKLKSLGINIYNQQVFTYFNSRRYETAFLRKKLKLSGIDPYYIFNTKGKAETIDFRVPISRLEQERKEEARLLPGIVRTDESVFNVPKLGKSHLRAWQDHEPIMILADGSRVYRFYPWESKLNMVDTYNYTDVSIYSYLKRLYEDGEHPQDYNSIWYYF
ncbi:MAG: KamA family radical SAM protein [Candidatus Woesearchaeota archaeon]